MKWIDTHAHLYENSFNTDLNLVIQRALDAGVEKILIQNVDASTIQGVLDLENRFKNTCIATMGLHPCSVTENYMAELQLVKDWWQKRNFTAVAEIGLDYYWDKTFVTEQQYVFTEQLLLALEKNVPVCIHSRSSFYDCIKIIKSVPNYKNLKGVFHCFSGSYEEAMEAISLGFYLGIGGVFTYKNSNLKDVLNKIGLEKIILETDAPYLPPVPHRGKRNESSYIPIIAEKIAADLNISLAEVSKITSQNANKLFTFEPQN